MLGNTHSCHFRYSKGFGIVGRFLGDGHFLNLPNTYMGLIFYPIMMILGKYTMFEMMTWLSGEGSLSCSFSLVKFQGHLVFFSFVFLDSSINNCCLFVC